MKKKIAPLMENIGESAAACLVAMVQGNIFAVTATHWLIAAQTGIAAGTVASITVWFMRSSTRWRVAIVLAVVTAVVDYIVHPGMLGPWITEAVVTGLAAGALSLLMGAAIGRVRRSSP